MKNFLILFFVSLLMVGCSSIDKEIVGTWKLANDSNGCDPELEGGFKFNKDNTVEGIDGFKEYKIDKNDSDEDIAVLSGGYEDTRRYKITIKDDTLRINEDDSLLDYKIQETNCEMKKVD